jgi:hypothetical protein
MSRQRAKRILGMTIPQWTVLGALALSICCIFVGGYYWLNSMVAAAYAVPDLPMVDVTPLPSATSLPTETPLPTASPTPITYRSLVPDGWRRYRSDVAPGMEIWLPSTYANQTEKMQQGSTPVYDNEAAKVMALWDPTPSPYMLFTTFEASVRPTFASSLDEMIDTDFSTLMRTGRLLERDEFEFQLENYPARRLVFDVTVNGVNAGFAVYVVQVGRDLYYLIFATPFNELYTRLPDFDKTIQTFRIGPIVPTPGPSPTPPPPTNTPLQ